MNIYENIQIFFYLFSVKKKWRLKLWNICYCMSIIILKKEGDNNATIERKIGVIHQNNGKLLIVIVVPLQYEVHSSNFFP